MDTPLLDLPDPLLVEIFKHLDLQQCLQGCALVNQRLLHVCESLVGSIHLTVDRDRTEQLSSWLQRHPASITSLQLSGGGYGRPVAHLLQLPCTRLRRLDLQDVKLQLGAAAAGGPGVLAGAAGLTRLTLRECIMLEGDGALQALLPLTQLRHLSLAVLCSEDGEYVRVEGTVLSRLLQLTHLTLSGNVSDTSLGHLAHLTGLRELLLEPDFSVSAAAFAGLSGLRHLTFLSISGAVGAHFDGAATGLSALSSLRRLELYVCGSFEPRILRGMVAVEHLVLSGMYCRSGTLPCVYAELLEVLGLMRQLRSVSLESSLKHHAPAAPEAYGALTRSRTLEYLDLTFARLPAGVWGQLFAAGLTQPQLRVLKLYNVSVVKQHTGAAADTPLALAPAAAAAAAALGAAAAALGAAAAVPAAGEPGQEAGAGGHAATGAGLEDSSSSSQGPGSPALRMTACDVARMVACCPSLEELVLVKAVQPGQLLGALTQLTRLTSLHVDNLSDAATGVLAQLVGLRELHMLDPGSTTDAGLLQLTRLTELTSLYVSGGFPSSALTARLGIVYVVNKAPANAPPDVWQQLLERCQLAQQEELRSTQQGHRQRQQPRTWHSRWW